MNINEIKAIGEYVILELEEIQEDVYKQKGKLLVPTQNQEVKKSNWRAKIYDVGELVDKQKFNKDDYVIFNDYDIKYVGDEKIYGITKASSIMAFYK